MFIFWLFPMHNFSKHPKQFSNRYCYQSLLYAINFWHRLSYLHQYNYWDLIFWWESIIYTDLWLIVWIVFSYRNSDSSWKILSWNACWIFWFQLWLKFAFGCSTTLSECFCQRPQYNLWRQILFFFVVWLSIFRKLEL